jgi:hypothetical protein
VVVAAPRTSPEEAIGAVVVVVAVTASFLALQELALIGAVVAVVALLEQPLNTQAVLA